MEASEPTSSTILSELYHDVREIIPAEEVCEYTFKVELIEKDKVSIVVFNTTTGIKYQTYIEEYSDIWESLKINFQHNFPLFYKMFTKALIEKDPSFTINVLHKIDYVDLQVSYVNDLLGFTIDLKVNQYKKDNLQELVNIMEYKQKLLEDENKSLQTEIKNIYQELTELKRIINLLGDGFSYDNRLIKCESYNVSQIEIEKGVFIRGQIPIPGTGYTKGAKNVHDDFDWSGIPSCRLSSPVSKNSPPPKLPEPFINVEIANKLSIKLFHAIIDKYKLSYDIKHFGYDWTKLSNMMKEAGIIQELSQMWQSVFTEKISSPSKDSIQLFTYDFTWKSFKELYDITI